MPYRLRTWLDRARIAAALRGVARTPPFPAAPAEKSPAEVHMLLCRRDMTLGVLSLKSLLRYCPLAVCLTNDGSLGPADCRWVERHIPGVRWLQCPAQDPVFMPALVNRPRLRALYQGRFVFASKLLHPILLSRSPRAILLDSDTAFFKPPLRIIDWLRSGDRYPLYLHDHQDEPAAVPVEAREAFAQLEAAVTPPGRTWSLRHRFFNAGLLLFQPDALDLDLAERYEAWRAKAPEKIRQGKSAIWFGDWTAEQTCYHVMFALAEQPARPLGDDYHLGGEQGHTFNHFLRHYLVRDTTLEMLKGLIASLRESGSGK